MHVMRQSYARSTLVSQRIFFPHECVLTGYLQLPATAQCFKTTVLCFPMLAQYRLKFQCLEYRSYTERTGFCFIIKRKKSIKSNYLNAALVCASRFWNMSASRLRKFSQSCALLISLHLACLPWVSAVS